MESTDDIVIGSSLHELHGLAARVAPRNIPVLVTGETGVGKELFVRRIHSLARRSGDLQVVNCAALPPELSESMLFGHERGAFTGADRSTTGFISKADKGTLFLDEIGELGARAQAALLRVLQEGRLLTVGSTWERTVDVRVVSATHRDLEELATNGSFRVDLLYRLNAVVFHIPPLRDRSDEIPAMAQYFLRRASEEWGIEGVTFAPTALDRLQEFSWPGNIRQLRNAVRRLAALAESGQTIGADDLPGWIKTGPGTNRFLSRRFAGGPVQTKRYRGCACNLRELVHDYERELIVDALDRCSGSITLAAKMLGLPIRTLSYKIRLHDIPQRADAISAVALPRCGELRS